MMPNQSDIFKCFNGVIVYSNMYISFFDLDLSETLVYLHMCKNYFINPTFLENLEDLDDLYYLHRNNYIFIYKYALYFMQILKKFANTYIIYIYSKFLAFSRLYSTVFQQILR